MVKFDTVDEYQWTLLYHNIRVNRFGWLPDRFSQ